MASRGLSGLLAFLLAARFLLLGEAVMEDLSRHKGSNAGGGLGDGGGSTSVIVLPRSFRDEGAGKESRSAGESGKAAVSSSSSSSSTTSSMYNDSKEAVSCPASCFRPNPVCGVDGVTYWCGSADAECAGVEVEYVGFCDLGSRGTGGKGGLAIQSLLLVHMIWLMLAAFLVLLGVP